MLAVYVHRGIWAALVLGGLTKPNRNRTASGRKAGTAK